MELFISVIGGKRFFLWMEIKAYRLGFYLSRSSLAMKQHVNRLLKEEGHPDVSMGFVGVLLSLYEGDGRTISELGEDVSLEKSTMTGLIDRMVRAGLITREQDESDRRVLRIWLTEPGRKIQAVVGDVLARAYDDLTLGLADRDIEKAERMLVRIIENSAQYR